VTSFDLLVGLAAVVAGAIAAVAGFGIGSVLTPLLGYQLGLKLAVAVVSIPHFVGTGLRLWLNRRDVSWPVLKGFGLASAGGGLAGALLHGAFQSSWLTYVLASLLVFVGVGGLTGLSARMRFEGPWAWIAGVVSGGLGGLVGNQGGIRAGAMLGMAIDKRAFVATATAIGLMVDLARMPVYAATSGAALLGQGKLLAIATVGVVAGTLLGTYVLRRLPERPFRMIVAGLVLALGLGLFAHPE
jgi:uncharacterized membrane protein YfcA